MLLPMAFMWGVVAPSNEVDVDDLVAWQQKCNESNKNLTVKFREMIHLLQPSFFERTLTYEFTEELDEKHRVSES